MDKPSVYIETSIVSYLAARPSRDAVTLRNQELTHEWWNTRRERYALYTSGLTKSEAAGGNPRVALRRLAFLDVTMLLPREAAARQLAEVLFTRIPLPEQARADAEHIAAAAIHGMAYLLTWDSRHIANPRLRTRIERICAAEGFATPMLVTPAQLLEREL